jgi:hypothetical protein
MNVVLPSSKVLLGGTTEVVTGVVDVRRVHHDDGRCRLLHEAQRVIEHPRRLVALRGRVNERDPAEASDPVQCLEVLGPDHDGRHAVACRDVEQRLDRDPPLEPVGGHATDALRGT